MTTATANAVFSPIPSLDRRVAVAVGSDATAGAATVEAARRGSHGAPPASSASTADVSSRPVSTPQSGRRSSSRQPMARRSWSSGSVTPTRSMRRVFGRGCGIRPRRRIAHQPGVLAAGLDPVASDAAAQAVVEGILLARYRYDVLRTAPKGAPVAELTLIAAPEHAEAAPRAERGEVLAGRHATGEGSCQHPTQSPQRDRSCRCRGRARCRPRFDVEVFDKAALIELGCGGLLGSTRGAPNHRR